MDKTRQFIVLNAKEHFEKGLLKGLTLCGDALVAEPEKSMFHGAFYSASIDSHERGFAWQRAQIMGDFPEDAFVRCSFYASDSRILNESEPDIDLYLSSPYQNASTKASTLDSIYTEIHSGERDFYIRAQGRYLYLKVEIILTGMQGARLQAIRLQTRGDHMIDYLPALYKREDSSGFMRRFVSIFNNLSLDLEERIALMSRLFDYEHAEGEMLRYLAQWVDAQPGGSDEETRERIGRAVFDHAVLQTPRGIEAFVEQQTGYTPILLEHFNFAEVLREGKDRELYERLYGENPFRLTVALPETAFSTRAHSDAFLKSLQDALPAHVEARLLTLSEGVYLDRYAYLGMNTRLKGYRPLKVDDSVSLDYNTIVGQ
ncbi:hypothetical protein LJC27_02880 [Christensenellaceae bacterium OttesenSCG-928-M15]|nr:hypothetical protein [Christensenellaceae bacterium OttesenSCG-928-M15]